MTQIRTSRENVRKTIGLLTIEEQEAAGGHAIFNHLGRDDEFDNVGWITDWLNDDSDGEDLVFEKTFDEVIGRGFFRAKWHNWKDGAIELRTIRVVLKKRERRNDTIFVLGTAYPVTDN